MKPPSDEEARQILNDVRKDREDRRTLSGKHEPTPGVCRVCSGKVVALIAFPNDGRIGGPKLMGYIKSWYCEDCRIVYRGRPQDVPPKESPDA